MRLSVERLTSPKTKQYRVTPIAHTSNACSTSPETDIIPGKFSQVNSVSGENPNNVDSSFSSRPFISPFQWSSACVRLSSQGPWRPASLPCMRGGRPSPQTLCSPRSLRSSRDRHRQAAGWRVWCPYGWSCGSALGDAGSNPHVKDNICQKEGQNGAICLELKLVLLTVQAVL